MTETISEEQRDEIFHDYIKSELDKISDSEAEDIYSGKDNLKQIIRQKLIKAIQKGYDWTGDIDNHPFVKHQRELFQDRAADYLEPRTIGVTIERTRERGVVIEKAEEEEIKYYARKSKENYREAKDSLILFQVMGKGATEASKQSIEKHIKEYGTDDVSYHGFFMKGNLKMGAFSKERRGFVTTWFVRE